MKKFLKKLSRSSYLERLIKKGLVVGKNFKMMDDVAIDWSHCWHISIGDDVIMAPRVHILAHDASTKNFLNCTRIGKVKIGNRVFIGASSIILPGVTIGDDVIIGAGSVVSRDVPDGMVAAGNPAKVLGPIDKFLERRKKEMEKYPYFDEKHTDGNVTDAMKKEMNMKMKDKYGYII